MSKSLLFLRFFCFNPVFSFSNNMFYNKGKIEDVMQQW